MTDSDWASCRSTRRSNSGGLILIGKHLINHWCRVQPRIALSSGEAEFYSSIKGVQEAIHVEEMFLEEREIEPSLVHHVDAVACKGILLRHGVGQLKHMETKMMWIQGEIKRRKIRVIKVHREDNPPDALASASLCEPFERHIASMGGKFN